MQGKRGYKISFVSGELAGRSFAIPPEGILIGKSRAAAIRPGGADIKIEHAALHVREPDSALILESFTESVFVDDKQLEPSAETVLTPGSQVRLGKNLIFTVAEDSSPVPPPPAGPAAGGDDEATEDETEEGASKENDADRTRYASPEELNDLRKFSRKQSSRQKITLAVGIVLLLLIIGGGVLYSKLRQENPLTWPGELTNQYEDGEFRIQLPPLGKFMIYYPKCKYTQVRSDSETDCEVLTLLGKNLEVPFHLKLEVNTLPEGFIISRKASFTSWRERAEKELGFTFLAQPEQRFYAMSSYGIPYYLLNYKRIDSNLQWQGLACYLRYHDKEIIFTREVPIQHFWRAENVLNQYSCFVAAGEAAKSYWEIPEEMPEKVSLTELYRSLLEDMPHNVAVIDWPKNNRLFAILLSQACWKKDVEMMENALGLFREFRERQIFWYTQACLAYQHYQQNENWEMMRTIRNDCFSKFPSPDEYWHTKVVRNIWTMDE